MKLVLQPHLHKIFLTGLCGKTVKAKTENDISFLWMTAFLCLHHSLSSFTLQLSRPPLPSFYAHHFLLVTCNTIQGERQHIEKNLMMNNNWYIALSTCKCFTVVSHSHANDSRPSGANWGSMSCPRTLWHIRPKLGDAEQPAMATTI